jgi:hypothetical protein
MGNTNRSARKRHVHLGERLEAIQRIRRGGLTVEEAAAIYGTEADEVKRWLEIYPDERPLSLDEVVRSPDVVRLTRRTQRLADLIATSESTIRMLRRLLR